MNLIQRKIVLIPTIGWEINEEPIVTEVIVQEYPYLVGDKVKRIDKTGCNHCSPRSQDGCPQLNEYAITKEITRDNHGLPRYDLLQVEWISGEKEGKYCSSAGYAERFAKVIEERNEKCHKI